MNWMRSLVGVLLLCVSQHYAQADFLKDFPQLSDLTFREPGSPMRLGLSVTPVGIMKDKTFLAMSPLQVHWYSDFADWEVFSVWLGVSNARNKYADSRSFIARSVPKFRVLENLSLGPIVGYELVTFPEATSKIYKGRFFTPQEEPFSSRGWVYGGMLSLTFPMGSNVLRVSPMYMVRTYPHKSLKDGWAFYYTNPDLQTDAAIEELAPESLVAIELGIML
jgi:hypothetical protein